MAIYYDKLFCSEGQELRVKNDIFFNNARIMAGALCTVDKIVGYGFDMRSQGDIEFRIMNSQMSDYFEPGVPVQYAKIEAEGYIVFSKDMVYGSHAIYRGQKFIVKDTKDGYHELFDCLTFEKAIRMSDGELREYCLRFNYIKEDIIQMVDAYWKFDESQQPLSSWNDKQDLLKALEELLINKLYTDEKCN